MPFFLKHRNASATELMDEPHCDIRELENTYRQFSTINSLISGWRSIYTREIRPFLRKSTPRTLLDVGFGGGDIPIKLAEWAAADGFDLRITAIDPDPRALDFVQQLGRYKNVEFLQCSITDLNPSQHRFDFVISNHVLHHLTQQQLSEMLDLSQKLSKRSVIFNDGRRSDIAYLLFSILSRPIFRSSFITKDGLTSIKRSYTVQELITAIPDNWIVEPLFPFRLLLMYHHG